MTPPWWTTKLDAEGVSRRLENNINLPGRDVCGANRDFIWIAHDYRSGPRNYSQQATKELLDETRVAKGREPAARHVHRTQRNRFRRFRPCAAAGAVALRIGAPFFARLTVDLTSTGSASLAGAGTSDAVAMPREGASWLAWSHPAAPSPPSPASAVSLSFSRPHRLRTCADRGGGA